MNDMQAADHRARRKARARSRIPQHAVRREHACGDRQVLRDHELLVRVLSQARTPRRRRQDAARIRLRHRIERIRPAAAGAHATGIDISPVAIEMGVREAASRGLRDRTHFAVMNAEALDFPDASFDRVCGSGILHHLDLKKAYGEIARVLRPNGYGIFLEPLGHNPLINWYRRRTPQMRTEDEHPLLKSDLALARDISRRSARVSSISRRSAPSRSDARSCSSR